MDTIIKFSYSCTQEPNPQFHKKISLQCRYDLSVADNIRENEKNDISVTPDFQIIRVNVREVMLKPVPETALSKKIAAKLKRNPKPRITRAEKKSRLLREKMKRELQNEIAPLLDDWGDNLCLFEESLPGDAWIRRILPFPPLEGCPDLKWMRRLLPEKMNAHFIVLGTDPGLERLLEELAPQMKSLLWILPDFSYEEQANELAERFYQETGLAMELQFLPEQGTYGQIRIRDERYLCPVNILDFSGQKYIPYFHPVAGSVWIDFCAVSEKEKRIEARCLKADYISVRTLLPS